MDNSRLQELYLGDQKDREQVYHSKARVDDLSSRDKLRRELVYEMMSQGALKTPLDLYHAAVILQHGALPKDFLAAHRLAVLSAVSGHRPARWLLAASLDRYLVASERPQIYGTQFEFDEAENQYRLNMPIDESSVMPAEKALLDGPSVPERLKQLNSRIQDGGAKK